MDIYIKRMNINLIPFSYTFGFTAQDIAFFEKKTGTCNNINSNVIMIEK